MAYNLLNPVKIFDDVDMLTDPVSTIVEVMLQDNVGVQLHWTGDVTGTFYVEVSMDYLKDAQGHVVRAGNWVVVPVYPTIVAAGVADDAFIDLNQIAARYARVKFVSSGGTSGTLSGYLNAKGV